MPDLPASSRPWPRFKSPLAALAVSFASGIACAHSLSPADGIRWILVGAATCILVGLLLLRSGRVHAATCMVLVSMSLAGGADALRWERRFPFIHVSNLESLGLNLEDPVGLEGRVISTPFRTGYGLQFDIEVSHVAAHSHLDAASGKVRMHLQGLDDQGEVDGGRHDIKFGDEIRAVTRLRRPHVYQNPGSFDFRQWMEDFEDVYWIGTANSPRQVEILSHSTGLRFNEHIEHARQRLLRGIDDMYPPWSPQWRNGAVLKAVLWGNRTELDSITIDDFRKTGLYHLLVIAGLHIGLLTLLLESCLRLLRFRRLTRTFITLGLLGAYALLVEQRAPTLRATLMISLYLVARILNRGHSPLNSLGGVALILLFVRPAWLFESGFQLSFSAALLIVGVAVPILDRATEPYRRALLRLDDVLLDDYFEPRLAQTRLDLRAAVYALRRHAGVLDRYPALSRNLVVAPLRAILWMGNIVVFSAILQLGLILPMVETFHRVTFAGIGLNAIAIPLMTILLALALPINLLSVVSPAAAAVPTKALSLVMAVLFNMTHLPEMASWLSYRVPPPPAWMAWEFGAAFVLAGVALRLKKRWAPAALAACALSVFIVAIAPFGARVPHGELELTRLDCGRGEAEFLVLPGGASVLIDAGGGDSRSDGHRGNSTRRSWNAGEEIVSPYLWSRGIKQIDVVVLTRPSADNLAAIGAIIENFHVGELWRDSQQEGGEDAKLLEQVTKLGIPTRILTAGDELLFNGALIRVEPSKAGTRYGETVGLSVSAGTASFLLPGSADGMGYPGMLVVKDRTIENTPQTKFQEVNSPVAETFRVRLAILGNMARTGDAAIKSGTAGVASGRSSGARIFSTREDGATTVALRNGALVIRTYKHPQEVEISTVDSKPDRQENSDAGER